MCFTSRWCKTFFLHILYIFCNKLIRNGRLIYVLFLKKIFKKIVVISRGPPRMRGSGLFAPQGWPALGSFIFHTLANSWQNKLASSGSSGHGPNTRTTYFLSGAKTQCSPTTIPTTFLPWHLLSFPIPIPSSQHIRIGSLFLHSPSPGSPVSSIPEAPWPFLGTRFVCFHGNCGPRSRCGGVIIPSPVGRIFHPLMELPFFTHPCSPSHLSSPEPSHLLNPERSHPLSPERSHPLRAEPSHLLRQSRSGRRPLRRKAAQAEPPRRTAAQIEPLRRTAAQAEPLRWTAAQAEPLGRTAAQAEPLGRTAAQAEPLGRTAAQAEPLGRTAAQAEPLGRTAAPGWCCRRGSPWQWCCRHHHSPQNSNVLKFLSFCNIWLLLLWV